MGEYICVYSARAVQNDRYTSILFTIGGTQELLTVCVVNDDTYTARAVDANRYTSILFTIGCTQELSTRGGGLGLRPKKMYGERLGDGVEYHLMSPTPRR